MRSTITLTLVSLTLLAQTGDAEQVCNDRSQATTPAYRFTANPDGTVTDTQTRLTWQRCPLGFAIDTGASPGPQDDLCVVIDEQPPTWSEALQAAETSTVGGFTDWRLPNVKELLSIVERKCVDPAWNTLVFPTAPTLFWTASTSNEIANAKVVEFSGGYVSSSDKNSTNRGVVVRLVRGE